MKSNSYARVACKILKYLNECYENSLDANVDSLNASMLGTSDRQLIIRNDENTVRGCYVEGIEFMDVIPPENSVLNHPRNWHITSQG